MDNEFWGMQQAYYKAQRKELEDLRKENAELKAKIADGIRVYASKDRQGYAVINHFGKGPRNATLLLDEGE